MHEVTAATTIHEVSFVVITKQTFMVVGSRGDVFPSKLLVLYFPEVMQHEAVLMGKLMRRAVCYRDDHEPFFSLPIANIAITCLLLLEVASSPVPATVTPVFYFLAMAMNAHMTLRTVFDWIAKLRILSQACGAGSA